VADGLEADVVTMNQSNDIEFLADKGLVAKDWAKKFPNNASPYTSTMVFIVRKGNPKAIKDWNDLAAPGMQIIIPHRRTPAMAATPTCRPGPGRSSSRAAMTRRAGIRRQAAEERAVVRRRWARRDDDLHAAQDG
jgi:hypothetical protein